MKTSNGGEGIQRINWKIYSSISVRDFTQLTLHSGANLLIYVLAALFRPPAPLEGVSAFQVAQVQEKNLYVRRDLGANDHQFHRIHWMMPGLEVQKDQHSAQKTLLSNFGKDAKNNLGCRLMVGPVLLAAAYYYIITYHTTLLHKPSSYIFAAHCMIRTQYVILLM